MAPKFARNRVPPCGQLAPRQADHFEPSTRLTAEVWQPARANRGYLKWSFCTKVGARRDSQPAVLLPFEFASANEGVENQIYPRLNLRPEALKAETFGGGLGGEVRDG